MGTCRIQMTNPSGSSNNGVDDGDDDEYEAEKDDSKEVE